MKTLIVTFLLIGLFASAPTQAQDPNEGLVRVNELFGGQVRFKIDKRDRLVADFFDQSGHYRQDMVYLEFLAPEAFAFNAEEQVVMLRCADAHSQCIDKEVFKLNTIRHMGRMNLPLPAGDPDGSKAIAALSDLIRQAQAGLSAVETKSPVPRKN
ncbi:MAG: hypothetical protein IPN85_13760 [Flavobacteriales bacterium]|nr:hypothetical protein [Flavobacteriales bacterium]MBK9289398.1 hypothetical protein [Flavobacteriales bacterium]MBL0035870.1 hypothetical protein [Flavobacteriales bacterium]